MSLGVSKLHRTTSKQQNLLRQQEVQVSAYAPAPSGEQMQVGMYVANNNSATSSFYSSDEAMDAFVSAGLASEPSFRVEASGAVDAFGALLESPSLLSDEQAEYEFFVGFFKIF